MKGSSYDTRFLIELYYSSERSTQRQVRDILQKSRPNYISTVAFSEIYRLTLEREGKELAEMRAETLTKDFRLVNVDKTIAVDAATIKHKHRIPLADSLIAATARVLSLPCYTDDPHFQSVERLIVRWIR